MTTAATLIERSKQLLLGNTREEINLLNGAISSTTATTVTLTDAMGSVAAGAEIEIDTELMRVRSVAGQVATVIRGWRNTTAATHVDGSVVTVNPRFLKQSIFNNLNHALNDLSAEGLYKEVAINVTYNPVVEAYDLAGSTSDTVLDVLEVRFQQTGPSKTQPVIRNWSLMRDVDTSIFASGNALKIDSGGFPGLPLRVRYAANFTALAALTDDITTTAGLRSTADDLPAIGAAIRELMGRDIKRTFLEAQPDTRRSAEVPPGVAQGALTTLRRMWDAGVQSERQRQLQRFPYRTPR